MKRRSWVCTLVSWIATLSLLLMPVPQMPLSSVEAGDRRTVDPSTMDSWKRFYGPDMLSTQYAGGVWMDKSVLIDAAAFPEGTVSMTDPENGFLVALSAIASNKEIHGYATVPTDTVLTVDVSDSVTSYASTLVDALNTAVHSLLASNYNNRVAVVAYAEDAVLLLPLGRYTASDGVYFTTDGNTLNVSPSVCDGKGMPFAALASRTIGGGNYMQAGLFAALRQFESADPYVEEGNVQGGEHRLPVLVLVSDGAPTLATGRFDNVGAPTAGDGGADSETDEIRFLTQLTAAYVRNRAEWHYDRVGEGLFYTLGIGADGAVFDPSRKNDKLKSLWTKYHALDGSTGLELHVPETDGTEAHKTITLYKNAQATDSDYVDRFFYAAEDVRLAEVFGEILSELTLRSRYYPTHLEGGNPDLSGYIVFEDPIGAYMEVKDIKGILLGERLFSGEALAAMLKSGNETGPGSVAVPSALGEAFRDSVKARLGLPDNTTAIDLISKAVSAKQLDYDPATGEFSNHIAWYADAAGTYVGFWDGTDRKTAPDGAVYAVRSYGFLGETGNGVRESDMMYMTVQVRTELATEKQQVIWKIPAALVPMVTYEVSFDGASEATARNVRLERREAQPIRLVYEVGLDDALDVYSVGEIYDAQNVRPDGTRLFWTNAWDASAPSPDDHMTSTARFTPSEQNERYYYVTDMPLYQKQGDGYAVVNDAAHAIDPQGAYYRARCIFTADRDTSQVLYEPVSAESLREAVWNAAEGCWTVPEGTVYRRQTDQYFEKDSNVTGSAAFAYNLTVTMTNASYEAQTMLGNNGRLLMTPATGIKLSKALEFEEPAFDKTFRYRLTATDVFEQPLNGTFPTHSVTDKNKTDGTVTLVDGKAALTVSADETLYITDLPYGATFTLIEEAHEAYRVQSASVNGVPAQSDTVTGTIELHALTDVQFVSTARANGGLYIRQTTAYPFEADVASVQRMHTATVTLTSGDRPLSAQTVTATYADGTDESLVTDDNGCLPLSLLPDDTAVLRGIPDGTSYAVTATETAGYACDEETSQALTGLLTKHGNVQALLARRYAPRAVSPENGAITVAVETQLEGRAWQEGDIVSVCLEELHPDSGAPADVLYRFAVEGRVSPSATFDLTDEVYDAVGTYHYRLSTVVPSADNGIVYDTAYRRFHVDVTDRDLDGQLEIARVSDVMNTSVTGDASSGYTVGAVFRNRYAPRVGTVVSIPVQTRIRGQAFPLSGFRFALLDRSGRYQVHESGLTDADGLADFKIAFSADNVGTHRYRLVEVDGGIPGMTYDSTSYTVEVTVRDRLDGTTAATYTVYGPDGQPLDGIPVFENMYASQQAALVLSGQKELAGRVHSAEEFAFSLYETDADFAYDASSPLQTVTSDYNGGFLFEALTFDAEGVHYYVLKEQHGTVGGVVYDKTVYKLTVTVEEQNGVLTAHCDREAPFVFRNRYEAQEATVTPNGTVIFTGRHLKDGELSFVLCDEEGRELERVRNRDARFAFSTLRFAEEGVYRYTVTEVKEALGGMTYDAARYVLTVTVKDNGHGKLYATVRYEKNGVEAGGLSFRNAYTAKPLTLEVTAQKELTGRAMEEGEFLFVLIGGNSGRGLHTAANARDGAVRFEPLTVHEAGTYILRISEVNTGLPDVTYDDAVFELTVEVTDDERGHLVETARTVRKFGAVVPSAVFRNDYHGVGTVTTTTTVSTATECTTTAVTTSTAPHSPQTGEGAASVLWIGLLIAAGAVVSVSTRMRRCV